VSAIGDASKFQGSGQARPLLRLVPQQLIAWRGLLRPVSPASTASPLATAHGA